MGSGADRKTYTEEQMAGYATNAKLCAVLSFVIPILIIVPFHYAPKAKKSSNPETVNKAKSAEKTGLLVILAYVLFFWYIFSNTTIER